MRVFVKIEAAFDSTNKPCKEYLTEEAPFLSVAVTQLDIDRMREWDREQALAGERTHVDHADSRPETLALANVVLEKLLEYGVLLFQSAVMAVDGKVYLFMVKSGIGKTTIFS